MEDQEVLDARAKLAQRFGDNTRLGGKGTMRRKMKVQHKTNAVDDKKLTNSIKKLGIQPMQGIDEANFFREDNMIMHFQNPKVQANIKDNFFVVSGPNEVKSVRDLMPGILTQLGPNSAKVLQDLLKEVKETKNEEDEVPELVDQNFEDIANQD